MWLNFSMICFFFELWFLIMLEMLYLIGKFNRFIRLFLEYVGYYYNDVYGDLYIFWNFFIGFIDMKYGVVFWNFYLKYFYDQFVVEGYGILKDLFLYNFYIIRFYYEIYSNGFIFSVEVISFEFKDFFVFIKVFSFVDFSVILG